MNNRSIIALATALLFSPYAAVAQQPRALDMEKILLDGQTYGPWWVGEFIPGKNCVMCKRQAVAFRLNRKNGKLSLFIGLKWGADVFQAYIDGRLHPRFTPQDSTGTPLATLTPNGFYALNAYTWECSFTDEQNANCTRKWGNGLVDLFTIHRISAR